MRVYQGLPNLEDFLHTHREKIVVTGERPMGEQFWDCAIPASPVTEQINTLVSDVSAQERAWFFYHCFCVPKSTLKRAIRLQFLRSVPGLSVSLLNRLVFEPETTTAAHLDLVRKNRSSASPEQPTDDYDEEDDSLPSESHSRSTPMRPSSNSPPAVRIIKHSDWAMDSTMGLPKAANGAVAVMVVVHQCGYVKLIPMLSQSGDQFLQCYNAALEHFEALGLTTNRLVMDNGAPAKLLQHIRGIGKSYTLVPPYNHRANQAERVVRTFKKQFKAMRAACDKLFPWNSRWPDLLHQSELVLNLVTPSRFNSSISAYEQAHGPFNYTATPFLPPGYKVSFHQKTEQRGSWANQALPGYAVGPAMDHHRVISVFDPATQRVKYTDTWALHGEDTILPGASKLDLLTAAMNNLGSHLQAYTATPISDPAAAATYQSLCTLSRLWTSPSRENSLPPPDPTANNTGITVAQTVPQLLPQPPAAPTSTPTNPAPPTVPSPAMQHTAPENGTSYAPCDVSEGAPTPTTPVTLPRVPPPTPASPPLRSILQPTEGGQPRQQQAIQFDSIVQTYGPHSATPRPAPLHPARETPSSKSQKNERNARLKRTRDRRLLRMEAAAADRLAVATRTQGADSIHLLHTTASSPSHPALVTQASVSLCTEHLTSTDPWTPLPRQALLYAKAAHKVDYNVCMHQLTLHHLRPAAAMSRQRHIMESANLLTNSDMSDALTTEYVYSALMHRTHTLSPDMFDHEHFDYCMNTTDDVTGAKLTASAIKNPSHQHFSGFQGAKAEEIERILRVTKTMRAILPANKQRPDRKASYVQFVPSFKYATDGTPLYRIRMVYGGDRLRDDYDGPLSAATAALPDVKLLWNSVLSTKGGKFMTMDLKDFFLCSELPEKEYCKIPATEFTNSQLDEYDLRPFIVNGTILFEIDMTMYGLPQAAFLSQQDLKKHLVSHGFYECKHTPCFYRHLTRNLLFGVVVDDFGIQYTNKADAQWLETILKERWGVKTDWTGDKFLGLRLEWDYAQRTLRISMPEYVRKGIARFRDDSIPFQRRDSPALHTPIQYGKQTPHLDDDSPPLPPPRAKRIQCIVGYFLYYARAIDSTMLVALARIATEQALPTEKTEQSAEHFLDYANTWPNATIVFRASDMQLVIVSDAAYLSERGSGSRAGGIHFCGNFNDKRVNGAAHVVCARLNVVVASAAEAELGAFFINCQYGVDERSTLEDFGWPQRITRLIGDNECAKGIATGTIKARKSKSMDMRFHWIVDRVLQKQFEVIWEAGKSNLADFFTKIHPAAHHRMFRRNFVFDLPSTRLTSQLLRKPRNLKSTDVANYIQYTSFPPT
jgi:hypothetical protein